MNPNLSRRLILLDRDGTLNVDKYVTYRPDQLEIIPGVKEGLQTLARWGCAFAIVSNQGGIGRSDYREEEMWAFNDLLFHALAPLPLARERFYFCPHDAQRDPCPCRKPQPFLLLKAAQERGIPIGQSYMIGDKLSDILAGVRAGCKKTILVRTGITDDRERYRDVSPDFEVADLIEAAEVIGRVEGRAQTGTG